MKKLWKSNTFWEIVGYSTLALCIFGQIAVGYVYLVAQGAYLIANVFSVVRDFALDLPRANKVRDIVFTGITLALIVIKIF
jgi:hypothetical protein